MIKSMTGYGSAKGTVEGIEVCVELKSVNNKFLDTSVRLPRNFLFAEETIKSAVMSHISRGKVDVFVTVDTSMADDMIVKVNEPLLKGYIEALESISKEYGLPNDITAMSVSRFPDVLNVEKKELDADAVAEGIRIIAEQALCDFDGMRIREGAKLKEDVLSKLETIEKLVGIIETESPKTVEEYREKLKQKLFEVLGTTDIDETRIITEAAIFADKVAVDEETVRLHSHMAQLRSMLDGGSPIGRKIDFLLQEFNREANTTGSKCQNAEIAHVVVNLKSEIEKIREQIQNIE
ncbi:MAG: YicC family protein [Oscillospiraceae bacterium]|nr:YicC family protein [Oscillospiraceae bacterium]